MNDDFNLVGSIRVLLKWWKPISIITLLASFIAAFLLWMSIIIHGARSIPLISI